MSRHHGRCTPPLQPLWRRVAAVLAVLLVAAMSTAQVCHSHQPLTVAMQSSGGGQGEPHQEQPPADHCLLCVAMHSALPASLQTVPEPVLQLAEFTARGAQAQRLFVWRFALASRPPPAEPTRS